MLKKYNLLENPFLTENNKLNFCPPGKGEGEIETKTNVFHKKVTEINFYQLKKKKKKKKNFEAFL